MPSSSAFWENKLVRDPLYGFIGLSKLEDQILRTSAMQRLSRIKQLAHTYVVYPSAVHTRLEHSLGTLYIAGRISEQLGLTDGEKQICRAAAFVHDLGHGPFSHLFEEIMAHVNGDDFSHEEITKLILQHDHQLSTVLGSLSSEILSAFDSESFISQVVSSNLDADKMDYLRRDSYHTGVAYGVFDLERVVRSVCKVNESDESYLAIDYKGKDALESYRLARYSMHTQVYEHHTRLVADDMFVRAVNMAIDKGEISRDYFDKSQPQKFIPKYLELDDSYIETILLNGPDSIARQLINDIRQRKLLKRAFIVPLTKEGVPNPIKRQRLSEMSREEVRKIEESIAREADLDPAYVIVHLQSIAIKLYERFEQVIGGKENDKPILIRERDGSISSLDEESPITASRFPLRRLFVFCPEEKKQKVKEIAESVLEAKSVYS